MKHILDNLNGLPIRLRRWEPQLHAAQLCYGVSPYLLAAVMERESLGGDALRPHGPKGKGDFDKKTGHGHGHGLMQIDDRSHETFLAAKFDDGTPLWQDPAFNIFYAAKMLRRNLDVTKNNVPAALAAYNAGLGKILRALRGFPGDAAQEELVRHLDKYTHGGNYVSDVIRRMMNFTTSEGLPNA